MTRGMVSSFILFPFFGSLLCSSRVCDSLPLRWLGKVRGAYLRSGERWLQLLAVTSATFFFSGKCWHWKAIFLLKQQMNTRKTNKNQQKTQQKPNKPTKTQQKTNNNPTKTNKKPTKNTFYWKNQQKTNQNC